MDKEKILLDALNTFGNFTSVEQEFNNNQLEVIYEAMNQVLHIAPVVEKSEQLVCHCNELPDGEIAISSKALQKPYGDLGQTDR